MQASSPVSAASSYAALAASFPAAGDLEQVQGVNRGTLNNADGQRVAVFLPSVLPPLPDAAQATSQSTQAVSTAPDFIPGDWY